MYVGECASELLVSLDLDPGVLRFFAVCSLADALGRCPLISSLALSSSAFVTGCVLFSQHRCRVRSRHVVVADQIRLHILLSHSDSIFLEEYFRVLVPVLSGPFLGAFCALSSRCRSVVHRFVSELDDRVWLYNSRIARNLTSSAFIADDVHLFLKQC